VIAQDQRTHDDLINDLLDADWNLRLLSRTSDGVMVSFRKHYTSDFPGMETREVGGKDEDEVIRTFLAELDAEQG
jgi:hypothetical protein